MAVNLSPVGGVAAQFFTNNGVPLTGGKIFTYAAGTTTPQASYTTSQGNVAWTNPIVLDAAGRVPSGGEIWLTDGLIYKFILKDANDVLIATYDNITGINSNSVAFVNQQEIVTATAGQTVFNLGINYQPATNSLSVFVDGVNQYGPGAQYSYVETDSNTVTFNSGLHVGAEVKFTTTQQQSAGAVDAQQVTYDPPFTGSVATNVEAKLAQYVSVKDFGATGDGATDDLAAIQAAIDYCATSSGTNNVYFPAGDYYVSGTINLKVGVSLIGPGKSLAASAPYARITGAGGSQTLLKYTGVFGSEARISLSIRGLQFANAQYAIHLIGVAYWDISDCVFSYIRGSVSHAAIVLEDAIVGVIERCFFFFCAYGVRGDTGLQYHVSIRDNDFNVDTGTGLPGPGYAAAAILLRCDATNIGFGPINIENNNFIPAGSPGTNQTRGLVVACRGNVLNLRGNTFEAFPQDDVLVTPIDPITSADHTADAAGFWVRGGIASGNWHVDGASGGAGNYCYSLSYTSNIAFIGNNINPQTSVTGRPVVYFGTGSNQNTWYGDNRIAYKSGYTGAAIEETNSTYGTNIILENIFIDSTVDGPAWQNIKNGYQRLEPKTEYAPTIAQFTTANQGVEWMSSTSKRKMLVLSDGSAAVQARQSIETASTYTNPTSTVTLNGTERTLRFYTGGTVNSINGALYDGQILSVFCNSALGVTITETGNIRVNGGTTLALGQDEGATFVWYEGGSIWVQI